MFSVRPSVTDMICQIFSFRDYLSDLFRFRVNNPEGLDSHGSNSLIVHRTVIVVCLAFGDSVHNIHSLYDLSERSIIPVQVRRRLMHDEELGTGRIRIVGTCHRKYARRVLQRVILIAIAPELSLDGISGTAHAGSLRISALDHESGDDAVEDQSVIEALFP